MTKYITFLPLIWIFKFKFLKKFCSFYTNFIHLMVSPQFFTCLSSVEASNHDKSSVSLFVTITSPDTITVSVTEPSSFHRASITIPPTNSLSPKRVTKDIFFILHYNSLQSIIFGTYCATKQCSTSNEQKYRSFAVFFVY